MEMERERERERERKKREKRERKEHCLYAIFTSLKSAELRWKSTKDKMLALYTYSKELCKENIIIQIT